MLPTASSWVIHPCQRTETSDTGPLGISGGGQLQGRSPSDQRARLQNNGLGLTSPGSLSDLQKLSPTPDPPSENPCLTRYPVVCVPMEVSWLHLLLPCHLGSDPLPSSTSGFHTNKWGPTRFSSTSHSCSEAPRGVDRKNLLVLRNSSGHCTPLSLGLFFCFLHAPSSS